MRTGRGPEYCTERPAANVLAGVFLIVAIIVSLPVYSSDSSPTRKNQSHLPIAQSLPGTATFAANCTTPQTTFNLGETVCAKAAGLTGFRFQWVDPDGFAVSTTDITTDPQSDSFVLPSTEQSAISGFFTANNLGRWRVNAITPRNSANTSTFFTVRDPARATVDLSIVKTMIGSTTPHAGDPTQFAVTIVNNGPDNAVNAHFVDNVFSNALFDSLTQTGGPTFTCKGADCQITSLANGAVATFILNFTAGTAGGLLENTATLSSDTPELNSTDNSSTAAPIVVATTGTPPTCDLVVTAPSSVTLLTGAGATLCSVIVNDLDATLGTGSATDTCELVGGITRTGVPPGNNFPVGTTTITYTATDVLENSSSAIQIVTVIDNTPPTITCPQDMTLEPTCPSGAIAIWPAPVGTDNCPGATTAQSGGPADGSVFPIGTTPVKYTVTDASGNQASCTFSISVLTVPATLQNLEASVNASSLEGSQKQGLLPKLDSALDAFNRGNTKVACQTLAAFINEVQIDIDHGNVPMAQGQTWINTATHLRNAIGCTNNPCT